MARKFLLISIIGLTLILSACITEQNPNQSNIDLYPGASQIFEVSSDNPDARLVWYLDGENVAGDTSSYTFTAEQINGDEAVTHQLMVREEQSRRSKNSSFSNLTEALASSVKWTINILPIEGPQICYLDEDGDTYGDPNKAVQSESPPVDCVNNAADCNDSDAQVNPGMTEIIDNGKDDDCNPETPDTTVAVDEDQDGYPQESDCDDNDPSVHPDAEEIAYNNKDDDCDANTPDDDLDGDTYIAKDDCDDNDAAVNPGATETPYNGKDDDCNAQTPDDDLDGDSYPQAVDCDDNNANVNPDAPEIPYNGKNDDCSDETPDDDLDGDGFVQAEDCDDGLSTVNPDAEEVCNKIDDNCDGNIDEGCTSSDELAQTGLNLLIDYLQAKMISGATPNSMEDILPYSALEEIRQDYLQASLELQSDNPAAHFGLAALELVQVAYDIDSAAIIEFVDGLLNGTPDATGMGAMAKMVFKVLDSTADQYLENAMEHIDLAVNLTTEIKLEVHRIKMVTDANGNPVTDPETGRPEIARDSDDKVIFETEKSTLELDRTDVRLVRAMLNVAIGALHLYRAYDLNIADENGSFDYFSEITKNKTTDKLDFKSINSLMLALEYNDNRPDFLTMKSDGPAETQSSQAAFLAAIADARIALDNLAAETDDQADDIVTAEKMATIYAPLITIAAKFGNDIPNEFSLSNMGRIFDDLERMVTSTAADSFPLYMKTDQGDIVDLSINLSGLFSGTVKNLHQYLPYHYWFTITEETAYPADMLPITKNIIRRVMSNLFDIRFPIPLNDDYSESELQNLPLIGRLNDLTSGIIGYSSINIENILAPEITIVFPDLRFGGVVQDLTQEEINTVVMSFSSTLFNQEE